MIFPYVLFLSLVTIQRSWQSKYFHITHHRWRWRWETSLFSLIPSQNMHRKHCLAANLPRTQNKLSWMNYHLQNDSATRALLSDGPLPLIVSFSSLSSADCRSRQSSFQSNNFFCQPSNDLKTQYPNVRGYFAFKFVFGKTWMRCHLLDNKGERLMSKSLAITARWSDFGMSQWVTLLCKIIV